MIQDAISRLAQLSCGRPVLLLPLPVSSIARALPSFVYFFFFFFLVLSLVWVEGAAASSGSSASAVL